MQLPADFEQQTRRLMGDERYDVVRTALMEEPPVSIRLNPFKAGGWLPSEALADGQVPWCPDGYYLKTRPAFTFDPLLHAGLYYVQEASSMFIDHVLRQLAHQPVTMLDLCAAPGGKTTCARAALPEGSLLMANEPIRARANVLAENVWKQGHPDVIVTNNTPADYGRSDMQFDIVLCDVPCSGEGMFRKDEGARGEWSLERVAACQRLQREIVADIWPSLRPGGHLVYSTCTLNQHENEENVAWMLRELGAQAVDIATEEAWGITGSLMADFHEPVYRFLPGFAKGEGLFMAVVKKEGQGASSGSSTSFHILAHGIRPSVQKGRNVLPDHSMALSITDEKDAYPRVGVDYGQAVAYLRKEAIALPADTPRGIVLLTFGGQPIGFAKNVGNRANNLYPAEWKIKSTHIPDYETILRPA